MEQSLIKANSSMTDITGVQLAENRHMVNVLIEALNSIKESINTGNRQIGQLQYCRDFFLILAEIDNCIKQCEVVSQYFSQTPLIYIDT